MKKKIKVAVTGSIGSGKSEFCSLAEKFGFSVLRADQISKDLLESDTSIKQKVIELFGIKAYKDDKPDFNFIANIVFNDLVSLRKLEAIVHPIVIKKIQTISDQLLKTQNVVFVESALVYEADLENFFDYVVLITAPREIRLQRKLRNGFTEQDFLKRENNQIPDEEKKKRADFIFVNDKSIDELKGYLKILCITLNIPF